MIQVLALLQLRKSLAKVIVEAPGQVTRGDGIEGWGGCCVIIIVIIVCRLGLPTICWSFDILNSAFGVFTFETPPTACGLTSGKHLLKPPREGDSHIFICFYFRNLNR